MRINYMFAVVFFLITVVSDLTAQQEVDRDKIRNSSIHSVSKVVTDLANLNDLSSGIKSKIIYDKNGLQSELINYSLDNKVEIRFVYKYDEKGNRTEVTGFKPDGTVGNKWTYEYDKNNNLIRQTSFRPDGQVGRDYIFSYNEAGLRQSEIIYNNNELIEKIEYIYEFYDRPE